MRHPLNRQLTASRRPRRSLESLFLRHIPAAARPGIVEATFLCFTSHASLALSSQTCERACRFTKSPPCQFAAQHPQSTPTLCAGAIHNTQCFTLLKGLRVTDSRFRRFEDSRFPKYIPFSYSSLTPPISAENDTGGASGTLSDGASTEAL